MYKRQGLESVLERQTEILQQMAEGAAAKKDSRSSTIKVEPKISMPFLGDEGPEGNKVEEFYERFEEVCSLANNGRGMPDRDMLMFLRGCLITA